MRARTKNNSGHGGRCSLLSFPHNVHTPRFPTALHPVVSLGSNGGRLEGRGEDVVARGNASDERRRLTAPFPVLATLNGSLHSPHTLSTARSEASIKNV